MLQSSSHTALVSRTRTRLTIYCWSKKRTQVKKPKKAELQAEEAKSAEAENTNAPTPAPPPRITETGPRSLKSQLRYVRQAQADRAPVSPTKVTYRRPREESKPLALVGAQAVHPKRILKPEPKKVKAKTPEEKELEAAEQRALEHRAKIASLYRRKIFTGLPAALLIDGYNVMLQWIEEPGQRRLKRMHGENFDFIREAFLRDVAAYGAKELRVMVAFDAMGNPAAPPIQRESLGGIEVVFVAHTEADGFVASEARTLRKLGYPYVLVASNDYDVIEACWSNEIFPMSCMQLLHEIKKGKQEAKRLEAQRAFQANGRDLGSRMLSSSPHLYLELERMRRGC